MKNFILSGCIIIAALFSGCDNSSEPDNVSKGLVLNGQVKNWPFTSSYQLSYTLISDSERMRDTITHSNKAEISQAGEFSFELYQEPDPSLLTNISEYIVNEYEGSLGSVLNTDSLVIAPSDVKIAQAFFQVERNGSRISSRYGASNVLNSDTTAVKFLYVDKDVRVTGYIKMEMEGYEDGYYHYDIILKKGWNKIIIESPTYNSEYIKNISEGKCVFSFLLFS